MGSKGKEAGHKALAIIVILALLALMGIPPAVLFFFSVVVYFIWRAVERSEQHETRRVFDFYLNAHEILRDDERRWYGFELREAVEQGETVLHTMRDAPPLVYYALGALHHRAGEYEAAAEHLAHVIEDGAADELRVHAPSPELRRYVSVLRRLEQEPSEGPQTLAAIRGLERARRATAAQLLIESRARSRSAAAALPHAPHAPAHGPRLRAAEPTPAPPTMPPPITEVLRDVYEEEKRTA
ncbi:MAG TPA: hypothetical protein VF546_19720 [Pyrinomonadaceae bacterium]|jgi:nitrogen fixation-related uncharacterized protein